MNRKALVFLPLLLMLGVCALLLMGLQQDPKKIASALIGKPIPEFYQADLLTPEKIVSNNDLPDRPFLINIWGSWCPPCREEHSLLMELAAQNVPIIGVNYRDNARNAREFLATHGNPFVRVIDDGKGVLAMKLGVDGAPETYLADAQGIIRYRYSGMMDKTAWQQTLLPELNKLKATQ